MDEVYQEIHQEEDQEDEKQKDTPLGKLRHYMRVGWTFVFNHTIPVILKDKVEQQRLVISLLLSPIVLWFAKGGTMWIM